MTRVVLAFGLAVVIVSAVGCFKFESHSVSGKDPGELSKDELQDKVAEKNKWKSVSLDDGEDGVFEGTAVTESGEELPGCALSNCQTATRHADREFFNQASA